MRRAHGLIHGRQSTPIPQRPSRVGGVRVGKFCGTGRKVCAKYFNKISSSLASSPSSNHWLGELQRNHVFPVGYPRHASFCRKPLNLRSGHSDRAALSQSHIARPFTTRRLSSLVLDCHRLYPLSSRSSGNFPAMTVLLSPESIHPRNCGVDRYFCDT